MELVGRVIALPDAEPARARLAIESGRIARSEPLPGPAGSNEPFICPGFIDSHTHPFELGLEQLFADLRRAASVPEALARLHDRLEAGRAAGTMLGFNLDPDRLAERRYPVRDELDTVVPDLPTLVYRVDGHSAVANSAGLAMLAAHGVELGPAASDGVLAGPAYEQASRRFKARLGPDTVAAALRLASDAAARQGVTTLAALVGNDDLSPTGWRALVCALETRPVRMVAWLQTTSPRLAAELGQPRVGGCILVDGSFGSHTAALNEPYADRPDTSGLLYLADKRLERFLGEADALGLQTMVHAIGDRAVEQVVRVHESLGTGARGNPLRHRVEHAILLPRSLVERITNQHLLLGIQPAFEDRWGGPGRMYAARLGERWRQTNPWRGLLDSGVRLAGGSDAPITPVDPLGGIRAATRHPNPEHRLEPAEALDLFTSAAAHSLGLERETGRIEPGLEADLVLLDSDPRAETECRVLATVRAGRVIHGSLDTGDD
ncbi:amidohydrolase family protein [candidate division WOR-3 bacterium]|nr:amidohydrolase family protein [candidate division WOR-3 bacterium]